MIPYTSLWHSIDLSDILYTTYLCVGYKSLCHPIHLSRWYCKHLSDTLSTSLTSCIPLWLKAPRAARGSMPPRTMRTRRRWRFRTRAQKWVSSAWFRRSVVWCGVLQCGAVWCSVLQCVAVCCSVYLTIPRIMYVRPYNVNLGRTYTHTRSWYGSDFSATHCNTGVLQWSHYNTMQQWTHCNTLEHTHCNT